MEKRTVDRIPFDSTLWEQNYWDGVDDPRPLLETLLGSDDPDPEVVSDMLEGTYYVDNPSPHFFYLIPYALDLFERHTKSLHAAINLFCLYLHKAKEGSPDQVSMDQFLSSRDRIIALLIKALALVDGNSKNSYYEYQKLLAGLATSYGRSDLGRQIYAIDASQHIN